VAAINRPKMAGFNGGKQLVGWGGWDCAGGRQSRSANPVAGGKEFPYIASMITSKLTSKAQTTIPQAVRNALDLKEGDELAYSIEGGRVVISKASARVVDDPFALFSEWDSEEDRRAYADL